MGLIKKRVKEEKETISVRLEKGLLAMANEYAEYIEDSRDYVITEALAHVLRKDAEFQAHLQAKQQAAVPVEAAPLKVRKQPVEVPAPTPQIPQAKSI